MKIFYRKKLLGQVVGNELRNINKAGGSTYIKHKYNIEEESTMP